MPRDGSGNYTKAFPDVVTNTTIASAMFNGTVNDIATDLNTPRPIVAGGTGANNATQARLNMQAERSMQVVTNFDSQPWETGSFSAAVGATGSPDGTGASANVYAGTVEVIDTANIIVEARNLTTGTMYMRKKVGGTWGGWTADSGSGAFVLKAGDTMTGNLIIAPVSGGSTISMAAPSAGNPNDIYGMVGGKARWLVRLGEGAAETGSNAGSNFNILRWNDAGSLIDAPFSITRATGNVSMSSALSVSGPITTYGTLWSSASASTGAVYLGSDGQHFLWYDGSNYQLPNGQLWTAAGRVWGSNDGTPIFSAGGTLNGGIIGSGYISLTSSTSPVVTGRPTNDANAGLGVLNAAGNQWVFTANGNGNASCTQNFTATANLIAGNQVQASGGPAFLSNSAQGIRIGSYSGTNPLVQYVLVGNPAYGDMYFQHVHNQGVEVFWQLAGNASYQFGANTSFARKAGGGPWADSSDERIKTVVGNYEHGLDEVLQLNPVRFTYKGNDTAGPPLNIGLNETEPPEHLRDAPAPIEAPYRNSPHYEPAVSGKEFIGLIAQQAEVPMPELVTQRAKYFIDGVEVNDLRDLDNGALVYALVNAVKTLAARVAALEAAT